MDKTSNKITSKILFKGAIRSLSPITIGSGRSDNVDIEMLKGYDDKPYIPASSFIGVLRHYFEENIDTSTQNRQLEYFWGSRLQGEYQSHLVIGDLKPTSATCIILRTGVAIDNKKGIAKEKALYDYEILEPEASFDLNGEISLREGFDRNSFLQTLRILLEALQNSKIFVGALTTKGFGRIKLEDVEIYEFKFPEHGYKWLLFQENRNWEIIQDLKVPDRTDAVIQQKTCNFTIDGLFKLRNSLIIGSYPVNPEEPDKIHLKSKNKPVLSGTSIKGAIRSRAVKIINTFGNDGEHLLKETFGWADPDGKSKEKHKSRVIVEESTAEGTTEKKQARIKIDRFTGGVISGALFESQPIWSNNEKITIKITIKNYQDWEAGLMLLILKDLWNEDLPIGGEKNIGRGILTGLSACIASRDGVFEIVQNKKSLLIVGKKSRLEAYVKAFIDKVGACK